MVDIGGDIILYNTLEHLRAEGQASGEAQMVL